MMCVKIVICEDENGRVIFIGREDGEIDERCGFVKSKKPSESYDSKFFGWFNHLKNLWVGISW